MRKIGRDICHLLLTALFLTYYDNSSASGVTLSFVPIVGQFEKLTHYQYQRLAIRARIAGLRGVPDAPGFGAVGCRQTFIAQR